MAAEKIDSDGHPILSRAEQVHIGMVLLGHSRRRTSSSPRQRGDAIDRGMVFFNPNHDSRGRFGTGGNGGQRASGGGGKKSSGYGAPHQPGNERGMSHVDDRRANPKASAKSQEAFKAKQDIRMYRKRIADAAKAHDETYHAAKQAKGAMENFESRGEHGRAAAARGAYEGALRDHMAAGSRLIQSVRLYGAIRGPLELGAYGKTDARPGGGR